jgi:hypothetical protein
MHEATISGSERNGHKTFGGIAIAISSRIEIMASGYRQSPRSVDAPEPVGHSKPFSLRRTRSSWPAVDKILKAAKAGDLPIEQSGPIEEQRSKAAYEVAMKAKSVTANCLSSCSGHASSSRSARRANAISAMCSLTLACRHGTMCCLRPAIAR